MNPADELRHLTKTPSAGEFPEGAGLVTVLVRTPQDGAENVLQRCQEVLALVVETLPATWPSVDEWKGKLPQWFVDGCAPEESTEDAERWLTWWRSLDDQARAEAAQARPWSLADWIHWLRPDERQWYWWDSIVINVAAFRIRIEVAGSPVPLGALEWLLRVAGATDVEIDYSRD